MPTKEELEEKQKKKKKQMKKKKKNKKNKEIKKKRNLSASRDPPKPWSKDLKYVRKQM